MTKIVPFKFEFGVSLEYDINNDFLKFYKELCVEIFKQDFNYDKDLKFKSVSVEEDKLLFNSMYVSELFSSKLYSDYKKYIDNIEDVIFILDLSSDKGDKLLLPVINEIIPVLIKNKKNYETALSNPAIFLIIVNNIKEFETDFIKYIDEETNDEIIEPLYTPDNNYLLLEKFIKDGSVCFLGINGGEGNYFWKEELICEVDNFSEKIKYLKKDTKELIKYKLIKKVGHFKRSLNGSHQACQEYYYDGRYCVSEVAKLLVERLIANRSIFNPKHIVFYCPDSPWVKDVVILCSNEILKLKSLTGYSDLNFESCININEYNSKEIAKEKINELSCQILFVVDFIFSATTFQNEYLTRISKYFPNADIRGVSVLCSDSAIDKFVGNKEAQVVRIEIPDLDSPIETSYLQNVDHKVYDKYVGKDFCPMCHYDLLDPVSGLTEGNLKLSSYEMWLMANTSTYLNDHVQSKQYKKLKNLPDTRKLIQEFGPYFAYKFSQNIDTYFSSQNEKPNIIVFPDERSNADYIESYQEKIGKYPENIEDTPSGFYATCLKELLGFEILPIPRSIMKSIQDADISFNDIHNKFPEISKNLESLRTKKYIIIDEYYLSGDSFDVLLKIMNHFGHKPISFFPIINYGLENLNEYVKNDEFKIYSDIVYLNFYEFSINKKWKS